MKKIEFYRVIEFIRQSFRRFFVAGLMALLGLFLVLYYEGIVVIPFLDVPSLKYNTGPAATKSSEALGTKAVTSGAATAPAVTEAVNIVTVQSEVSRLLDFGSIENPVVTDAVYSPDKHMLSVIKTGDMRSISYGAYTVEIKPNYPTAEPLVNTYMQPAYWPRMGFIFRQDQNGNTSLLSPDLNVLVDSIPENIKFIGERDFNNNPLFLRDSEYLFWSYEKGGFEATSFNPETDYRGIKFDYPSYYGKSDCDILRVNAGGKWGYNKNGVAHVALLYAGAYEFSEERGVMFGADNFITVRNMLANRQYLNYSFYRPVYDSPDKLGYYYFNHGLIRMRALRLDGKGNAIEDREIILTKDGGEFEIPKGYSVISYSDGVFLLKKDEYYGYYSYEGRWICQPVYTYARPFYEGLGVVGDKDGKVGVIDTGGSFVINRVFDYITDCSGGVMALYDASSGWYLVNKINIPAVSTPVS